MPEPTAQRTVADQRQAGIQVQEALAEELHALAIACRGAADLISLCRSDVSDRHVAKILTGVISKLQGEARTAEASANQATERAEMLRWHQTVQNRRRSDD